MNGGWLDGLWENYSGEGGTGVSDSGESELGVSDPGENGYGLSESGSEWSGSGWSGSGYFNDTNLTGTCAALNIQGPVQLPYSDTFTIGMRYAQMIVFLFLFIAGLSLNSLVIGLVAKYKNLRTYSIVISLQIVVLDLFLSALYLISVINAAANRWLFGEYMCAIIGMLLFTSVLVRTILMFVFVIDRCLSVFWTFRYPKYKVRIISCLSAATWGFSLLVRIPLLPGLLDCYTFTPLAWQCAFDSNCNDKCAIYSHTYIAILVIPLTITPVFPYIALYYKGRKIRKTAAQEGTSTEEELQKRERRSSITFFLLFLTVFILALPNVLISVGVRSKFADRDAPRYAYILSFVGISVLSLLIISDPIVIMRDKDIKERLQQVKNYFLQKCCPWYEINTPNEIDFNHPNMIRPNRPNEMYFNPLNEIHSNPLTENLPNEIHLNPPNEMPSKDPPNIEIHPDPPNEISPNETDTPLNELPPNETDTPLNEVPPNETDTPLNEVPPNETDTLLNEVPPNETDTPLNEVPPNETDTPLNEVPPNETDTPLSEVPPNETDTPLNEVPPNETDTPLSEVPPNETDTPLNEVPPNETDTPLSEVPPNETDTPLNEVPPNETDTPLSEVPPNETDTPLSEVPPNETDTPLSEVPPNETDTPLSEVPPNETDTPLSEVPPNETDTPLSEVPPNETDTPLSKVPPNEIDTPPNPSEIDTLPRPSPPYEIDTPSNEIYSNPACVAEQPAINETAL